MLFRGTDNYTAEQIRIFFAVNEAELNEGHEPGHENQPKAISGDVRLDSTVYSFRVPGRTESLYKGLKILSDLLFHAKLTVGEVEEEMEKRRREEEEGHSEERGIDRLQGDLMCNTRYESVEPFTEPSLSLVQNFYRKWYLSTLLSKS